MRTKTFATITAVSYGRTVNIGNYQSVRFDLTAEVKKDDEWYDVLEELRDLANREEKRIQKEGC